MKDSGNEEQDDLTLFISGRGVKRARIVCNSDEPADPTTGSKVSHHQALYDEKDCQIDLTTFKPIYIIGEWEDEREERRVTVAILMPSGSFETPRDHDFKVSDDGMSLDLTVVWPRSMTDMFFLHKSEIDQDCKTYEHHPRLLSFRPYLRRLRSKADQKINSTCAIPLPTQVKPDIALARRRRKLFVWLNTGQKVLYVTLEALEQDYVVEDACIPSITIA